MITIKLQRFFTGTILITLLTLLYVHQNIEIVRMGYSVNTHQKTLSYFLDQHRRLVYNLNKLKSPSALNEKLYAEAVELVETGASNIYYASIGANNTILAKQSPRVRIIDRLLDTFIEKAEATVNR